ncbi:hypothetical protein D8674_040794 [Pyrus ussuriensis x Pyrus communis]|uniref:Uncharacterized protein n=1 Tax=Pyrus ussuriensis x Pyrus communis TaxID=2448454 RepID=A0A5N5I268_9ROSA|nr:hypothetical protein D8674_040794 [Pyrus ussuriensis x Pyrus communis]
MQGLSHKSLDSRHSVDSCAFQLYDFADRKSNGLLVHTKRPCLSNRTTSFSIDAIDMSQLTLVDDDKTISDKHHTRNGSFRFIAKNGEKENVGVGFGPIGGFDAQVNKSGYGSEPGYRGDAEFSYGNEFDEEEEDTQVLFWGDQFRDADSMMETVRENTFADQKSHHKCRRKKHDCRMGFNLCAYIFRITITFVESILRVRGFGVYTQLNSDLCGKFVV